MDLHRAGTLIGQAKALVLGKIGPHFSSIRGVSEAAGIHGRALEADPASAQVTLSTLGEQLGWAAQNLARSGELFSIQELMNQVAFDHADAGWTGQMH
ncbi:MAG: hypothetical protein SOW59_04635, partial [Corynebacterium sp.]|nr:hypothetical protein [Corynebacterium sp.]